MKSNCTTLLSKISKILISFIIIFTALFSSFWLYASEVWGTYSKDALEKFSLTTHIYDNKDNMVSSVFSAENRVPTNIENLPEIVKNAFIAAEDLRFYDHCGIDVYRMAGALVVNLKNGEIQQGASTITQQLVKLSHGLTPEKKIERKLQEIYYAILIERDYTKDEILEMYLDCVYFGNGAYGIESAAEKYFNKEAKELNLTEAASLAAILKAPSNYAPHINENNNKQRRELIIRTMLEHDMITSEEAQKAISTPLHLSENQDGDDNNGIIYSWFTKKVIEDASNILKMDYQEIMTGGYKLYTTLDTYAQKTAFDIIDSGILPTNTTEDAAQCAVVLMKKDGAVKCLIGGSDIKASDFSRATDAKRQPGSVLKPLAVFTPSIEIKKIMPTDFFIDEPKEYSGYTPGNFGDKYYGKVNFRNVFEKSLNIPAVDMLNALGIDKARDYMTRFGLSINIDDRYLSLALGSMKYGVSPYELCAAYLTFINSGSRPKPYTIKRIINSDDEVIYEHKEEFQYVVSPQTAFIICDLLKGTATNGTAKKLAVYGYPIGAKTGTVDYNGYGNRDAWICSVTPNHALTVWIGYDKTNDENHLDRSVTGSNHPTKFVLQFFKNYLPEGDGEFIKPDGVDWYAIDKKSYDEKDIVMLSTSITPKEYVLYELFEENRKPSLISDYWQIPSVPSDIKIKRTIYNSTIITFSSTSANARYRIYKRNNINKTFYEIASVQDYLDGTVIEVTDQNTGYFFDDEYYITAEHAVAFDMGVDLAVSEPSTIIKPQLISYDLFERWNSYE